MKLSLAKYYSADPSNYTKGRLYPVSQITVHHTAGQESTLRYLWQNPARDGSSHFFVHPDYIEQYVDTDDTAWTNSSWTSNNKSITIEVQGDWRNGYYNQRTLDQLQRLLVELRKHYPTAKLTYHKDEADPGRSTVCPADLKDKGYAQKVWDNAWTILHPPAPQPAPAKITYKPITPKRVQLIRIANLWNFNFTEWSKAQAVGSPYPAGHTIDVVAEATNALGGKYYMTAYSYNNGNIRATNGFNVKDCQDFVQPAPAPTPTPPPVNEPTVPVPAPQPQPQPTPETPIDDDPTTPGSADIEKRVSALEAMMKTVWEFLKSLFSGFDKK
jgi:hypothetical protein